MTATPTGYNYTVDIGDTLSRISLDILGDALRWPEIAALNGLADPNLIHPGQVLSLPIGDECASARESYGSGNFGDVASPWTLLLPRGWWMSSPFALVRTIPGYAPHPHLAIDLAIPSGSRLPALAPGVVTFSGTRGGYGGLVEVETYRELPLPEDAPEGAVPERERYLYRYAHCSAFYVRVGDIVEHGRTLATSGGGPKDPHRGSSTGAHLHLEILKWDGSEWVAIDPLLVLSVKDAR